MNCRAIVLMLLVVGLLLAGCAQSGPPSGYATYSGQGQQQQQYVGGGCGVAPSDAGDEDKVASSGAAPAV